MLRFQIKIIVLIAVVVWVVIAQVPDKNLHLVVCDVGQGDAILLIEGDWQMLVDGGRGTQVLDCLGNHLPFWDKKLEVVVATHPDADHIGGLDDVFQAYKVEQFMNNGDAKNTGDYERLNEAFSREMEQGSIGIEPMVGLDLRPIDSLEVTVISPQDISANMGTGDASILSENTLNSETILSASNSAKTASKQTRNIDYNDRSIVLLVQYGSFSALLTGDLEVSGEQALLNTGMIKPITVLKVGHHGAKTSTSTEFISATTPEISVISVGKNNSYGHPSNQVLQNLEQIGSRILRTDQNGDIELITNGEWLKYEKSVTTL